MNSFLDDPKIESLLRDALKERLPNLKQSTIDDIVFRCKELTPDTVWRRPFVESVKINSETGKIDVTLNVPEFIPWTINAMEPE